MPEFLNTTSESSGVGRTVEAVHQIQGQLALTRLKSAFQHALARADGDIDLIDVVASALLQPEFQRPETCEQMVQQLTSVYVAYHAEKEAKRLTLHRY